MIVLTIGLFGASVKGQRVPDGVVVRLRVKDLEFPWAQLRVQLLPEGLRQRPVARVAILVAEDAINVVQEEERRVVDLAGLSEQAPKHPRPRELVGVDPEQWHLADGAHLLH